VVAEWLVARTFLPAKVYLCIAGAQKGGKEGEGGTVRKSSSRLFPHHRQRGERPTLKVVAEGSASTPTMKELGPDCCRRYLEADKVGIEDAMSD